MRTLLIAYDIEIEGGTDTRALSATVRALGQRWARPLASLWYVETLATVADVEAVLSPLIGDENALLIQEVKGEAALANTMLRWTGRSELASAQPRVAGRNCSWQPRLVPPAGGHLPNSETEVAVAA
jgi:hypothetical protein